MNTFTKLLLKMFILPTSDVNRCVVAVAVNNEPLITYLFYISIYLQLKSNLNSSNLSRFNDACEILSI